METGVVVRVVRDRGFFFLRAHGDNGPDLFAHANDLAPDSGLMFGDNLLGMELRFSTARTEKGWKATDIRCV